jgi:hypothetical protein
VYGFAGGDPVNSSDPFGLCTGKDGREFPAEKCRDVTAEEGNKVVEAADAEGQWTYTMGREGEIPKDFCAKKGDCTDYVEASMRGAGLPALSPRPSTRQYPSSNYRSTAPENARAGDVIIVGGHAGIITGRAGDGTILARQNGGSGVKTIRFAPGVSGLKGRQIIFRRQVPIDD